MAVSFTVVATPTVNVIYSNLMYFNGKCCIDFREVVCDMSDAVKQKSAGYASLNYTEAGYSKADLVKVEIAVNGISLALNSSIYLVDDVFFADF